MKKVLLGSTALVGASLLGAAPVAAAEAPTLSFSGYTRVEVSFVDQADVYTLGVSHNFASAPGMRAWAEIPQFEGDRTGAASDNDATYFMIGTQVAF